MFNSIFIFEYGSVFVTTILFLYVSKYAFQRKKIIGLTKLKHQLIEKNRKIVKDKIQKKNLSTEYVNYITSLKGFEITQAIRDGKTKPSDVLTAFQMKCIENEQFNFLAEFIEEAEEISLALDNEKDKSSPIFGLPISLKECIQVKGKDQSNGLIKMCFNPATSNSLIFEIFKHNKAIPFITTSMARAGLSHDSSNPIFGNQSNPRFPKYSAGGSSGGEGIALSTNSSTIGFATDIGGSARFPALFNQVYGINTTRKRLTKKTINGPGKIPRLSLELTTGPMSRCVEDLANFFRAFLCEKMFQEDITLNPLPFNETMYSSNEKLNIGFYYEYKDKHMAIPVPSIKRAIKESINVLQAQGHGVQEVVFPSPHYGATLAMKAFLHDGGKSLVETLAHEPLPWSIDLIRAFLRLPRFIKKFFVRFLENDIGKVYEPIRSGIPGIGSSIEAAKLIKEINDYQETFESLMKPFDILICPLFPFPLPLKNESESYNNAASCYSIIFNLLDRPSGTLPTGNVKKEDLEKAQSLVNEFHSRGDSFNAKFHSIQTDLKLPIGVQVVGKKFEEEKILRVMKILEEAFAQTLNEAL